MAEVAVGESPTFPMTMRWQDEVETYDSFYDLGVNLEFSEEGAFEPGEARPVFTDSRGARFRIIVMSLEVVLCVNVPDDFDPEQLRIARFGSERGGLLIETLGAQVHRALEPVPGTGQLTPLSANGVARLAWTSDRAHPDSSALSWADFDQIWLEAVDPAPPIYLHQIPGRLRARLASLLRRDRPE